MSRKIKYSYSQKLQAVKSVVEKNKSCEYVAKRLGSEKKHIRRWVAFYKEFGTEGLRIKPRRYSGEFKVSVLRYMYQNHLSLFETAVKFKIPNDSVLSQWARIYKEHGESGLYRDNRGKMKSKPGKPLKQELMQESLLQELKRLRTENAYLKKLKALVEQKITQEKGHKPLQN